MHPSRFFLTTSLAALFVFFPTASFAATYTVTTTDDTADGVCDSGCSLREAIIAANGGGIDTIIVPAGTYHFTRTTANEDLASTGDLDFTDTDLTTVTGAGSGLGGGATIIDPDDNDRGIDVKSGALVSITDLTVNDGNISSSGGMGAGILSQGSLTLNNVYVTGNSLTTAGSSDGYGAGLGCLAGSVNVTNSVISNNLGSSVSGDVYGGGLAIAPTCSATLSIVTISGNQAMKGGGVGMFTDTNTVNLTDVTISNNIADDVGGGLFVQGDDDATQVNINRALFQGNDATYSGGGVFAVAPLNIVNASFYENHAGDAGGAFGTDSPTSPRINLAFVTMTRNTADSAAPGLYVGGATPDTHIKNSIIASNNHTADTSDFEDCTGVPISDDYNYIAATASCDVVPAAHDITGTEAGSVYSTATPIDDGGNVFVTALWETGVTLDMIPSASCIDGNDDPVATDASGRSRPQNVRCDLGAYEKPDTVTQTPTLISPASSSSQKVLNLQYTLPETPSVATVTITNGSSVTRVLTMNGSTSVNANVDLVTLGSTVGVTGVSGGTSLPDGTYTVTLSYQDATGNTAATASATSVLIDTVTQSPTLTSPASSSTASSIQLQYTLPETPLSSTVKVTFTGPVTRELTMSPSTSVNVTINLSSLASTSNVASVTGGAALPDGTYTVSLEYQDALGNTAATVSSTTVTLDTVTQSPVLTSPTASSTANTVHFEYTLPEAPLTDTVRVIFTNVATAGITTFDMLDNQSVNITFNPIDSGNAVNFANLSTIDHISPSPMPVLADGTYTVLLRYQDALGNTLASTSAANVTIDTATQAPVVTAPTAAAKLNSPALAYTLPETPQSGTVRVVFFDGTTTTTLTMNNSTSVSTALQLSNLGTTSGVISTSHSTLSDGTYTVTVSYQDSLGNSSGSTAVTAVTIDTVAPTITLLGASTQTLTVGDAYIDPGYTATDAIDGNLHDSVHVLNTVNVNVAGVYTIYYTLTDTTGNVATQVTRTVTVVEAEVVEEPVDSTPTENTVSIPAKPTAVTVTKKKKAKMIIWDAVSESSFYNLIIKTKAGKTKLSKTNITALKYELTAAWIKQHLTVGKSYTIKLKACNTAGCSEWSTATTLKLSLTKPKS